MDRPVLSPLGAPSRTLVRGAPGARSPGHNTLPTQLPALPGPALSNVQVVDAAASKAGPQSAASADDQPLRSPRETPMSAPLEGPTPCEPQPEPQPRPYAGQVSDDAAPPRDVESRDGSSSDGGTATAVIAGAPAAFGIAGPKDCGSPQSGAPAAAAAWQPLGRAGGGMSITLQGLTCVVGPRRQRATILNDVSAYFEAGRLTAIMGPSGSGKTTLLDIVAGRHAGRGVTGDVRFGGVVPTPEFLQRFTGYVEQFDTLIPTLTVREMLAYTAALKSGRSAPPAARAVAVEALLRELDLTNCGDVMIGDRLRKGVSGGQAKRVNIGIALIGRPSVLFLDEPTSGLDSTAAAEVMEAVARLAAGGVTAVATIHSPTARAYELLDRVLMLLDGRVLYFGQTGPPLRGFVAEHLLPFTGGSLEPFYAHEAEALAAAVAAVKRARRGGDVADAYASGGAAAAAKSELALLRAAGAGALSAAQAKALGAKCGTATPWWFALGVLLRYRTLRNWRDPVFLAPRVGDKVVIGSLLAALYWGIGDDFSFLNLSNQSAFLFMWVALPCFSAAAYMPSLVLERALFARERGDGLYRVATYLVAKMVDELALAVPVTLATSAFVFKGVRLVGSFWLFWVSYFITLSVGIAMAYFIAAAAPSMDAANALLPTYAITLLLFAGQLMTFQVMHWWMRWYSYIDVLTYSWGALVINQFEGQTRRYLGGQTILEYYSLNGKRKWEMAAYAALFFPAFLFLAWLTLSLRRYRR